MRRQPDAVFIVDLRKEQLAVREAQRLGVPVVGLVDTNCDPDEAGYVIPGNDDAIRACSLIARVIADGIEAGKARVTPGEFAAPRAPAPAPAPEAVPEPVPEEPAPEAVAEEPAYEVLSQHEATVEPEPEPAPEPEPEPAPEQEPAPEEVEAQ